MTAYSEDHIALAAEYALGTLDAGERAQVETMMAVDREFSAIVEAWEYRLAALNQMVGAIEPRPFVWDNIRIAVGHAAPQAPLAFPQTPFAFPETPRAFPETPPAFPETPPPVAAAEPATVEPAVPAAVPAAQPAVEASNVIQLSEPVRRWRTVATSTSALAAALVALIGFQLFAPGLLPSALRPAPRTQVVEVKSPSTPAAAPSAQYVALLQKDGGSPAFILTVDGATRKFTVRRVGAPAPDPGRSFELWLISDRLPQPRSLGVIGAGDFTARPVLASYDPGIVTAATYAVTVEQAGGSPNGKPSSAPVYAGKLIESVPPGAPK